MRLPVSTKNYDYLMIHWVNIANDFMSIWISFFFFFFFLHFTSVNGGDNKTSEKRMKILSGESELSSLI